MTCPHTLSQPHPAPLAAVQYTSSGVTCCQLTTGTKPFWLLLAPAWHTLPAIPG